MKQFQVRTRQIMLNYMHPCQSVQGGHYGPHGNTKIALNVHRASLVFLFSQYQVKHQYGDTQNVIHVNPGQVLGPLLEDFCLPYGPVLLQTTPQNQLGKALHVLQPEDSVGSDSEVELPVATLTTTS